MNISFYWRWFLLTYDSLKNYPLTYPFIANSLYTNYGYDELFLWCPDIRYKQVLPVYYLGTLLLCNNCCSYIREYFSKFKNPSFFCDSNVLVIKTLFALPLFTKCFREKRRTKKTRKNLKKKFFKSQLLGPFLKLIKMFNGPERFKKISWKTTKPSPRNLLQKMCKK